MSAHDEPLRTLPPRSPFFVDRDDAIHGFRQALAQQKQARRLVTGPEGIGKTALSLELGHWFADHSLGPALYYDCRGSHSAPATSVPAGEIAGSLLRQLGIPDEAIPVAADERSTELRKQLGKRRALVLLDDVAETEQVKDLLFEAHESAVLVTSRNKLGGLSYLGFQRVHLEELGTEDAERLLRELGSPRELEPDVLHRVRAVCMGWPLALVVAGSRLADPDEEPAEYAAELSRFEHAAMEIDDENPVQRALDLGYHRLRDPLARAYALLSLIPGPHFDADTAAVMLGVDEAAARRILRQLTDRFVLKRLRHSRFAYHDYVRLHARDTARARFPQQELSVAVSAVRWRRYYQAVAFDKAVTGRPTPIGAERFYQQIAPVTGSDLNPRAEFELEWPNLVAAMWEKGTPDEDGELSRLFPLSLWSFGYQTGRCTELIDAYKHGLPLLGSAGQHWQYYRDLAGLHERIGEFDVAEYYLGQASQAGYPPGNASVHDWWAQLKERRGDLLGAVTELCASWEAVPMMGQRLQEERARALLRMHLGRVRRKLGELQQAADDSAAALAYFTEAPEQEKVNLARSARDLGSSFELTGRRSQARPLLERAHVEFRTAGQLEEAAETAAELAAIAQDDGDVPGAESWRAIADELRDNAS